MTVSILIILFFLLLYFCFMFIFLVSQVKNTKMASSIWFLTFYFLLLLWLYSCNLVRLLPVCVILCWFCHLGFIKNGMIPFTLERCVQIEVLFSVHFESSPNNSLYRYMHEYASNLSSVPIFECPSWLGVQKTNTAYLQRGKTPSMSILNMTLNNLKVRLQ